MSLADDVELTLNTPKATWLDRLPAEAQSELNAVRVRFIAGEYSAKPFQIATAVVVSCRKRGWNLPSEKTVVRWLQNR